MLTKESPYWHVTTIVCIPAPHLALGQWTKGLLEIRGQREWEARALEVLLLLLLFLGLYLRSNIQVPFLLAISPHCPAASYNPLEKLGLGQPHQVKYYALRVSLLGHWTWTYDFSLHISALPSGLNVKGKQWISFHIRQTSKNLVMTESRQMIFTQHWQLLLRLVWQNRVWIWEDLRVIVK